jgi:hypothetical protein
MVNKKSENNLRGIIKEFLDDAPQDKKLTVFDFDDTLVKTDSQVVVVHDNGTREALSPGQYAIYEKKPGDTLDYSAFRTLVNPRIIRHVGRHLNRVFNTDGPACILVLTARGGDVSYIETFLADAGFPGIEVVGLGCDSKTTAKEKAVFVSNRIQRDGLTYVEFLDDTDDNIKAIKELTKTFPNVKIITKTIKRSL